MKSNTIKENQRKVRENQRKSMKIYETLKKINKNQ